jgi:hypothetical protein
MDSFKDGVERARRLETQIRKARHHLEFGRTVIEHYKRQLEKYRAENRDTTTIEHFIEAFERSQKVFEQAELTRRRESAP